jgi:hypothetical protein
MCSLLRTRTALSANPYGKTVGHLGLASHELAPTIKNHLDSILNALGSVRSGDYLEISFSGEKNLL